jgi:hypothetical protein
MSNGYLLFASETTWGTVPGSGWRSIEASSDGHKTAQEYLQHKGLRAGRAAPSVDGRRIVKQKGTGSIEVPGFANGLGIFFRAAASTAATAVHSGGTLAHDQVFTWTSAGIPEDRAISTEVYRDRRSGTFDAYTYSGGRVVSLEIGQTLDDLLKFTFNMDYKAVLRQSVLPTRTPTEVDPDFVYAWPDATISFDPVGGDPAVEECVASFSLTIPNELDVDDWCLKAGTERHQPVRQAAPSPTGEITWKYQDPTYYDAFVAGEIFSLTATWEGSTVIEGSTLPSCTIEIPAVAFTGDDPEITVDNPTMQSMPFEVLDNGTDPAVTITFVTSDAAF